MFISNTDSWFSSVVNWVSTQLMAEGLGLMANDYRRSLGALSLKEAHESPIIGVLALIVGAESMADAMAGEMILERLLACPLLVDTRQRTDVILHLVHRYLDTGRSCEVIGLIETAGLTKSSVYFRLAKLLLMQGRTEEAKMAIVRLSASDQVYVRSYAYVDLADHSTAIAESLLASITDKRIHQLTLSRASARDEEKTGQRSPLRKRLLQERNYAALRPVK